MKFSQFIWSPSEECEMAASLGVSECRAAQGSEKFVGELYRELQSSRCEPLQLEAGRRSMEIVREPRVRGISAVGSHYQTTTREDTAD
jgi:hypothetical protein